MKLKTIFDSAKLSIFFLATMLIASTSTVTAAAEEQPAAAEEQPASAHSWSANMLIGSEYVFRGITQSNEDPAIQVGIDYAHSSGFYLGTWASSVEFNGATGNDTQIETNFYGGFGGSLGSVDYDLGGLFYYYPEENDDNGAGEQDFFEVYGSLGTSVGDASFGGGFAYSPDYYGEDGDSIWIYGEVGYSLPGGISPYATVGYLDVEGDETTPAGYDYVVYTLGASYDLGAFTFDLMWSDAESDVNGGKACGTKSVCEAVVLSISSSW